MHTHIAKRRGSHRGPLALRRRLPRRPFAARRLRLEPLEQRHLLAVVWDGGGGDLLWSNPLNWSEDRLPDIEDDVTIGDLPGESFVQFSGIEASIRSLRIQQPLEVNGGVLVVEKDSLLDADLNIFGGLLVFEHAAVEGSGTLRVDVGGSLTLINASLDVALENLAGPGIGGGQESGLLVLGLETNFGGGFFNGPDAVLSVQGDVDEATLLTVDGGFTNEGFIDLASAGFGPTTLALSVEGGPLINRGTITAFGDHADDLHLLLFDLVNEGFLDVLGDTMVTGQVTTTFDSEISVIATDLALQPVLTFDRGFINEGVIVLFDEATDVAEPVLRVAEGTLVNAADGQIISDVGDSLGPRRIEADIDNAGFLAVDQRLWVDGQINNSGDVIVSDALFANSYQQTGGSTLLDGGSLESDTPVAITAGLLAGQGQIAGNLFNDALVQPGPGVLVVEGDYIQTLFGRLEMEISGRAPGVQFDQLIVDGFALLDGALQVTLAGDFVPQAGDVFNLLLANGPVGQFADVDLPEVGPALRIDAVLDAQGYRLSVSSGEVAPPIVSIEDAQVAEGAVGVTSLEFIVRLSEASDETIAVDFSASDISARAGFDYLPAQGTIEIPAGETLAIVRVDVLGDLIDENDETLTLTLTGSTGADIDVDNNIAVGTILDDDEALIFIEGATTAESAGTIDFVLGLSTPSDHEVMVDFRTLSDTAVADEDFAARTGTIRFAPGETTRPVTVEVFDDLVDELDESFFVELTAAGMAQLDPLRSRATGTIFDDDLASVLIEGTSIVEGEGAAVFHVTLSKPLDRPLTIGYRTIGETATAVEDFEATIAQLVVPAGETSATIAVAVVDDVLDESNETFLLELTNAGDALLDIDRATGTIVDDDQAAIVIDDAIVFEGHQGITTATLTARLTGPVDHEVRVDFATSDETGDETAVAGEDYLPVGGTLVFAPGETTAPIVISVIGDRVEETRRGLLAVELRNPVGVEIGRERGLVHIIDDDVEVSEDAPPSVIDFSGLEDLLPITGLQVADNSNPALVSTVIDNATKTATLVYAPNAFGQADLSFDVLSGGQVLTTGSLSVSVAPVNDVPTAAAIDDVFAGSEASQITIDLVGIFDDVEDTDASLTLTTSARSDDPLFSAVDLDTATGELRLVFAEGAAGRQTVSVTATDSQGASASSDFVVAVDRAGPLIEQFALSATDDSQRGVPNDNTTFNPLPSLSMDLSDAFLGSGERMLSVVLDIDVGGPNERRVTKTLDVQSDTPRAMTLPLDLPLAAGPTVFDLRVTDPAGNSATDRITVHVDRQPPVVVDRRVRALSDDGGVPRGLEFTVFFSEELYVGNSGGAAITIGAIDDTQNMRLIDADGTQYDITSVEYRAGSGIGGGEITPPHAVITIDPPGGLPSGEYELTLIGSQITDRAGNFFGGSDPRIGFRFFTTPPMVENVRALPPIGDAASRGVLVELSTDDLTEIEAFNTANYILERFDDAGGPAETVPLMTAAYNSLADRIILWGETGLPAGTYRLVIVTEQDAAIPGSTGVTGANGLALDGDRDGRPGGRLVVTFTVEAASGSLQLDRTAIEGNLQALDTELKQILQQGDQSQTALSSDAFSQTLLAEVDLVLRDLKGADSKTIGEAVNARIETVFDAARNAEYLPRDFSPGEFIIAWGHDVRLALRDSTGATILQSESDRADGLSLAVVPVRLVGPLFSNELLTLDGVDARPSLTYTLELTGLAAENQAGVVYFGTEGEAAKITRADASAAGEVHELDLSDVLVGVDPRLSGVTETVIENVRAIVGDALDSFLILWLDPVDFALADSQGLTSEHTSSRNVDEAPGAIHVGNDFSELLVIPNAPADVYTLQLVGVGGEFRGEAIFVEGNSFRSAPLQGLLGSSDRLVAQIDFRNDASTETFMPPIFDVAAQDNIGGGVFAVADPTGNAKQATVSSDSSSTTSARGLADGARGGGRRRDGSDNWIEWLFRKLRRAIEDAEEEAEEEDEKPADREDDDEENENESTDPLGRLNNDDIEWRTDVLSVDSSAAELTDDEPAGESVNTDASEPVRQAGATDAALEEMEASAGAMLAVGLVREAPSRRTRFRRLARPCRS